MNSFYDQLLFPFISKRDVESTYDSAISCLKFIGEFSPLWKIFYELNKLHDANPVNVMGLEFPNLVGLAAGFDRNAECWKGLEALGFGHIEIGSISYQKYPGNPKPRIFCNIKNHSLINHVGMQTDGASSIQQKLAKSFSIRKNVIPLGINIGKSKEVTFDGIIEDYISTSRALVDYANYFTINTNYINTSDNKKLSNNEILSTLLKELKNDNKQRAKKLGCKDTPFVAKIAPDLTFSEIDKLLEVIIAADFSGIIVASGQITEDSLYFSKQYNDALCGTPLFAKILSIIKYIHKQIGKKLTIIASGGIFDEKSAGTIIDAGASLIQIYSALFFKGPTLPSKLANALKWHHKNF